MLHNTHTRRGFLKGLTAVSGSMFLGAGASPAASPSDRAKLHLACNHYPWIVFYRRENRDFNASLDAGLAEVAQSGMDGFEPIINTAEQIDQFAPLLKKHALEMRSLYVNSVLHESDQANQSIKQVLAIAEKAKRIGTRIIVTNPSPIRWGGEENKNDAQLITQARSLDKLGATLRSMGMLLSYHNHDIELRNAAREFHHMMLGTDPENVTLCLDAHWIYRGSGNSAVALFDVVKLYGSRVTELHFRQSQDGIWTETMCDGDVDYVKLGKQLTDLDVQPHLVIEQAVENETPKTMDAIQSHRLSARYLKEKCAELTGTRS